MRDLADELLQAKVKARLFGGDHAPRLGRLVIVDRIGAGAMGTIYAAYDPRLDRKVAVKVLHAAGAEANARFLREARALGKLAHPNVVAIHDAQESDGSVHVVMELADGVPLRAWIGGDHDWREVLRVMREAGAGLAAAHRAGLVHRDIKPENILIGGDRTRIVDFGLAHDREADDLADAAGTPSYMAPELLARGQPSPASDQFSFAVTLHEALYGERPHTGTTRDELRRTALDASKNTLRTRRSRPRTPDLSAPRTRDISNPRTPDLSDSRTPDARTPDTRADARTPDTRTPDTRTPDTRTPDTRTPDARAPDTRTPDTRTPDADTRTPNADTRTPGARTVRRGDPPGWVHAIVKRGLSARPEDRFPSLDALLSELGRDRRQRRVIAIAAAALAIGLAAGAIAYRSHATVDPCGGGATRRTTAWSDSTREQVRARLGDVSWAPTSLAALDHTASQWEDSFRRVCEATRVRGDQADRLLELRMRCLDRALDRFGALAAALAAPLDATARAEAASATSQLPRPASCETIVDAGELALPDDPRQRARATTAEHELDLAWTGFALGRYREARAEVTALEHRTADLAAPAVRAAILTLAGLIEARTGTPEAARAMLDRALAAAAAAHAGELELTVWAHLLRNELFAGQPARAIEWAPFAEAAAARAGRDGAELDGIVAEAQRNAGELTAARDRLRRALGSRDPLRDDQRAILEMNAGSIALALGSSAEAEPAFQRAHDASLAALGDGHPTLALYLDKLAEADRARGRIRAALARHDRSVALRRAAFGAADRAVATALFHRAETLVEAGQLARAVLDLDEARTLRAQLFGARSPRLGEIDAVLGDLAAARGRLGDARALYDRAAALDPRLELAARRAAAGAPPGAPPSTKLDPELDAKDSPLAPKPGAKLSPDPSPKSDAQLASMLEPFSIDRVPVLAARVAVLPREQAVALAAALVERWRAAGPVDAALSLAVGDAAAAVGDRAGAGAAYNAALGALAVEPSRSRLRALQGLARTLDDDAAITTTAAARAVAAALPEISELSELRP